MAKLRAAVIGLGRIGSTFDEEVMRGGSFFLPYCHSPSYSESPLVELVAGADLNIKQCDWFAKKWKLPPEHVYQDYRKMLHEKQPEIVSVCTSARHRATIVKDVARAGAKAIWAEKPIALSLAEADTMNQVCKENRTTLLINCFRRWNSLFYQIKQMIDSGDLGQLLQITVHSTFALSHNGSHIFDIMRFLTGSDVEWVFGEMESDEAATKEDDLKGNGYLAFANGVRGYVRSMSSGAALTSIDIIGENARIRTDDDGLSWQLIRLEPSNFKDSTRLPLSNRFARPLPANYPLPLPTHIKATGLTIVEDLVASIETGQPPRCTGEDGIAALEIAVALRESHRRGGVKVSLPITNRALRILSSETSQDEIPWRLRT